MKTTPAKHRKLWTQVILAESGEKMKVDELTVTKAMDWMYVGDLDRVMKEIYEALHRKVTIALNDDLLTGDVVVEKMREEIEAEMLASGIPRDQMDEIARESIVARIIDKMDLRGSEHDMVMRINSTFEAMLRTAETFVLDIGGCAGALRDAATKNDLQLEELPLLPFKRLFIEFCCGDDLGYVVQGYELAKDASNPSALEFRVPESNSAISLAYDPLDPPTELINVPGFCILEMEEGKHWRVFMPYVSLHEGKLGGIATVYFDVLHDGCTAIQPFVTTQPEDGDKESLLNIAAMLRRLIVTCVHIIDAPTVPKRKVILPRSQRKDIQRTIARRRPWEPKIYYVDINAAAEEINNRPTDRHLSVRFLVRGHWVHREDGKRTCPCHGHPASWRHAYVKGPAWAPWKGRPVYKQGGAS